MFIIELIVTLLKKADMFKSILGFFGKSRTILPAIGIALIIGVFSGWYVTDKFFDASKVDMYKQAMEEQRAAVERAIEQHEMIRDMDNEFLNAWIDENQAAGVDGDEFQKQVGEYVKNNDVCNLTNGAVGLFESLIEGGQADISTLSKTTSTNDEEGYKASSTTQLETLRHHGSCIENYNKLMIQHNTMVDWIDTTYGKLNEE